MDGTIAPQDYQDMKGRLRKILSLLRINSLTYNKKYPLSRFTFRRKSLCWRTSWNTTGSQTGQKEEGEKGRKKCECESEI